MGRARSFNGQQIADLALLPSMYDEDLAAVLSSVMPAQRRRTTNRYPLNMSFHIGGPAARITASLPEAAKSVNRDAAQQYRREDLRPF